MRLILSAVVVLVVSIVVAFFITPRQVNQPSEVYNVVEEKIEDREEIVARFQKAIALATVSDINANNNHVADDQMDAFNAFLSWVQSAYPLVFQHLKVEKVNNFSLFFTWQGKNPSLRPLLLLSHYDVVSAAADSDHWTHPPFSAHLDNNTKYIYGRGTLDTKLTVIGILEAIEHLLQQQQQQHEDKPIIDRTLIFALGHDEEVGGEYGAKAMAAILRGRGIQVEAVFDEGGAIFTDGLYPLVLHDTPIAVVGTAEKGFSTWKMVLHGTGGHSSWPVVGTGKNVASQVAKVLAALEKRQQLTRLAPPTSDFLQGLAPHVLWSSVVRLLLENASNRIINPILSQLLGWPAISPPDIQALVRTTCAVVSVSSGSETSHNIIPSTASITINCRLLPGDTSTDVKRYLEDLIKVDLHLPEKPELIQLGESVPGSAVASSHGPHFDLIRRAIQESGLTGGTSARDARGESTINNNNNNNNNTKRVEIVVPLLLTGMTDSRYYADLAEGRVYRFSPLGLNRTGGDMKRIHGIDERVSVENVIEGVRFFMRLITLGTVGIDA